MLLESRASRAAIPLLAALASSALAEGQDKAHETAAAAPGEAPVLARFLARPDEPVTRYRARRRMDVRGVGERAWMTVQVELDPERGFRWAIESEGGSRTLREKSLVRVLELEAEAHASGVVARSGLTADNYLLEAGGRDRDGLVRLRARARRRESVLFDGFFVVTPDTAELVRVEGSLARGPSFWIPRVEVTRQFARISGHRVVVRSESIAHLRLLGESRLVVGYDYEMIDGDPVLPPSPLAALVVIAP